MANIYEDVLTAETLINQCYDLKTGEINEEQEEQAKALKEEIIAQGLEKLCKVRANKLSDIDAFKLEEERIKERRKKLENQVENLEEYINIIYQQGNAPVQTAGTFTISTRKSTQVVIDDLFADDRFITTKEVVSIDKNALKKALTNNEQITGAYLETHYNLQIK